MTNYEYPHFPHDRFPIAFVDCAEFGYFTRLPDRCRQFANTFAQGSMGHDTKNRGQQIRLKSYLENRSFPYFIREMHKDIEYPASYHPIDYPLYKLSECHENPDLDEYAARQLELFSSWGESHPWRRNIGAAMRAANRKCEINAIGDPDNIRMPQDLYFQRMRAAKCSVSYDGYGSGSFRMTEILCRTLLLQGPLSIRTRAPLVDKQTCRMYNVVNDGEQFISTNVGEVMADALADPEGSFEIYRNGYEHVHTHLSERATAQALLGVVESHDWSRITPLEV